MHVTSVVNKGASTAVIIINAQNGVDGARHGEAAAGWHGPHVCEGSMQVEQEAMWRRSLRGGWTRSPGVGSHSATAGLWSMVGCGGRRSRTVLPHFHLG